MPHAHFQVAGAVGHLVDLDQVAGLLHPAHDLLTVPPLETPAEELINRVLDVVEEVGVLDSLLPFSFLESVVRHAQFIHVGVVAQQQQSAY